jgi:hypothetical protein
MGHHKSQSKASTIEVIGMRRRTHHGLSVVEGWRGTLTGSNQRDRASAASFRGMLRPEIGRAIGRRRWSCHTSIVSFFQKDRKGSFPFRRQQTIVDAWRCHVPRTANIAYLHLAFEHADR